jgi:hypothetical protein
VGNPNAFYDTGVHLVVRFRRKSLNIFAQAEEILPKLEGMSGCRLWWIVDYSKGNMENWMPNRVRLTSRFLHQRPLPENCPPDPGGWMSLMAIRESMAK